jgi:hypothetical protein
MHCMSWLIAGVAATLAQLLFEVTAQQLRLTRLSFPFLLGSMYTQMRSWAKLIGFGNHVVNGLIFAAGYILLFNYLRICSWQAGALLGLAQAAVVLLIFLPLIQEIHPRMASERQGPTARRQLEPLGFLALNYGPRTPLAIGISHVLFGAVFGAIYR